MSASRLGLNSVLAPQQVASTALPVKPHFFTPLCFAHCIGRDVAFGTTYYDWHRYLDLCDFIDDNERAALDIQPFRDTSLPLPAIESLPKAHSV